MESTRRTLGYEHLFTLATALLAIVATITWSGEARAFCGFYVGGADAHLFNDATNVVLMREGTRTVLSMQNSYKGPPSGFAMVVPVPIVLQKENVKTLTREIFDRIDQLGAPRLVEYWEQDPCPKPMAGGGLANLSGAMRPAPASAAGASVARDLGVTIEAQFTVGEYEIVILGARDSMGLDTWLRANAYSIPAGAEPYLRPYVEMGMKFFVAKVDAAKVRFENGLAMLSPLRFHYDSDAFTLPIRLGLINSNGTQDLIVNILARGQRYEVANYDNVAIPTNMDVKNDAKERFGTFYAALFDRTMAKHPRAVVTEYAWDAGSCDPCPLPALNPRELMTLGGDVMPSIAAQNGAAQSWRGRGAYGMGFVLTRLHTRYAKEALGDDLFFRPAPPIVGGREFLQQDGKLERGAVHASMNNFQARYAIRHPWTGPMACAHPQRGMWGGPPNALNEMPIVKPAAKVAFAPRGGLDLAAIVRGPIPAENLLSSGGPTPALSFPKAADADASAEIADASGGSNASAIAEAGAGGAADAGSALPPPNVVPPPSGGCGGCGVRAAGDAQSALGIGAIAIAASLVRRRRRRGERRERGDRGAR